MLATRNQLFRNPRLAVELILRTLELKINITNASVGINYFDCFSTLHRRPARPTLKPSKIVTENAQQFIDIYRYPPTRPEPLYPQPTPDKTAAKCRKDVCQLPDCSCGGKDIPGKVLNQFLVKVFS